MHFAKVSGVKVYSFDTWMIVLTYLPGATLGANENNTKTLTWQSYVFCILS